MFQVLFADCDAEAEGGETDKGPGELVGDTDDTIYSLVLIIRILWERGMAYFCSHDHNWPAPM